MLKRKVFRSDNSVVASLPKDFLETLGIQEGVDVIVALDEADKSITISPLESRIEGSGVDETFARQVADFIGRYRSALETLATE